MAGTLAPAQSQTITLGIRLPATINSEKSAQILIRSNDPRQPQVVCAATARAPAPWEVSQTHVNFGYVLREELAQRPRERLVVRPGRGRNALPTSAMRIQGPGPAYRVRWRGRPDGSLVIDISLRPGLSDGRYSSTLHLGHAEEPALISIPVDAELGPSVTLVPNPVCLVRDEAAGGDRRAQVIALARKPGLLLGPLQPLDWPAGISLKDTAPTPARLRRVEVLVDAGVEVPPAGLDLAVQAPDLREPLVLTVEERDTLSRPGALPEGPP